MDTMHSGMPSQTACLPQQEVMQEIDQRSGIDHEEIMRDKAMKEEARKQLVMRSGTADLQRLLTERLARSRQGL